MSENKHTPGPWYWNHNAGGPLEVCSEQGVHRCVARAHLCEADARLIAAAPKLLEALKALIAPFNMSLLGGNVSQLRLTTTFDGNTVNAARAAIAEAEGENMG